MKNGEKNKGKGHLPLKLFLCVLTILLIIVYIPFYNQEGVHSDAGFLTKKDHVFSNAVVSISEENGILTFSETDLSPLTVSEKDGFYTVSQNGNILYSGRMPTEDEERRILSDGTLTLPADRTSGYPLTLSQIILLGEGGTEKRGSRQYFIVALVSLMIWMVDILFPDFFFKSDFRNFGSDRTPSPGYRKVQRLLWILFPLWSLMFLVKAVL